MNDVQAPVRRRVRRARIPDARVAVFLMALSVLTLDAALIRSGIHEAGFGIEDAVHLAVVGVVLVAALLRLPVWRSALNVVSAPAVALCGLLLLSALWSVSPVKTAVSALSLLSLLALCLYAASVMGEARLARVLVITLTVFCIGSAVVYVLAPAYAQSTAWDFAAHERSISGRLMGFAGSPNTMGRLAALLGLLGLIYRRELPKPLVFVAGVVGLGDLMLSGSRTAAIALIVAAGAWLLMGRKTRWAIPVIGVGVTLGVWAVLQNFETVATHLARTGGNAADITTGAGRTLVWRLAAEMIGERPWLGYGYNTSAFWMPMRAQELGWWYLPPHPHNVLLLMLFAGGPMALLLLLVGVGIATVRGVQRGLWRPLVVLLFWAVGAMTETGGFSGLANVATLTLFLPIAFASVSRKSQREVVARRTRRHVMEGVLA